ncbi:putative Serpin family protein [Rosa chinensis]|uniref:Putative Serpin family protein n=1 Tax=Rosa chinensis TaxID=74649 RepID=A0A2P6P9V4_ROSCH|nr:putative Serpin family protein [Rosa chinensis]
MQLWPFKVRGVGDKPMIMINYKNEKKKKKQFAAEEISAIVSHIQHESFVDVNEDGTEAAAVTVAHQRGFTTFAWSQEKRVEVVVDHPFLFLIREETTGLVLFIGHILNPIADS